MPRSGSQQFQHDQLRESSSSSSSRRRQSRGQGGQAGQAGQGVELVIVSENGRHSDESRRIVRAQAARSSAAQSRVTRAQRRLREGSSRGSPLSPPSPQRSSFGEVQWSASGSPTPSARSGGDDLAKCAPSTPLGNWLRLLPLVQPTRSPTSQLRLTPSALQSPQGQSTDGYLHLPLLVPQGFQALQQRHFITDTLVSKMSRAACFNFFGPGVEDRLHQLLFDLIAGHTSSSPTQTSHPLQALIQVAGTALTIFQSQRTSPVLQPLMARFQEGLDAAWSEATAMDLSPPLEDVTAKVSLWALTIISVTAAPTATFFYQLLDELAEQLNCTVWEQLRGILLKFIYPSSFLDAQCRDLFHRFRRPGVPVVG